ncbi:MAG: SnoaL-like domain-containing protein [Actinobacteria bacterium]|jgi:limonene-1,2-epoxide hydrolase|nr:nuclear transport factor 2 family protein [Acidimicrobiaceae bacterium]MBP6487752.1 nuclear transport factor 2 family protein [Ilumatobacteraceae bacterium]NMD24844.1 SnoaL-like domain-containing protein [Actinomycetota bacterium]MBK9970738.1 nuclear transport factor 2 family protein [Acidimicrobiaceae bacterium]MBP7888908.1 nuclear transport factor 2 family protein [Ilumatobacteraceae bacterium]
MPAALVTNFITAIERGDLAHAITLLSDDCEYDNVPMGKVFGAVAVNDTLAPFLARYDRVEWIVHHQVSSGNLDHGVVMNERADRFRTGETWIEMPVAGLFLVRHGKIALWRDYFDRDTLLRQLAPASE